MVFFGFDYLPSESTKDLVGGGFLKIFWKTQPEIYRTMVNNHVVSLMAVMIKMVSKHDYSAKYVSFNLLCKRVALEGFRHLLTEPLRSYDTSEGEYLEVSCCEALNCFFLARNVLEIV